jgi:serine/threonine protein kinase
LQLTDALAFAHERGISHHDIKAANILIDASAGGKLLLADFGTAIKPGEETVGFTKSYAAPELLASFELEDFSDLRPDKIDSFALGCVLYELLSLKRLENISFENTLAHFITDGPGLVTVMDSLPLPFLPPEDTKRNDIGYSHELKCLVMNLLNPNVSERWLPVQLQHPLRHDPKSPLLLPHVSAAQIPTPGAAVTIDNIQLGLFVQRGPDWDDGDSDGPSGSIGVVVRLDADALYAEVAFPSRDQKSPETICCRIGASNKFELQVGPVSLPDFVLDAKHLRYHGIVPIGTSPCMTLGQNINGKYEIVGVDTTHDIVLVAPLETSPINSSLPKPQIWKLQNSSFVPPREPVMHPSRWDLNLGSFTDLIDQVESDKVQALFHDSNEISDYFKRSHIRIEKIQRIQDIWLFESYGRRKEKVAMENWGLENEIEAFMPCDGLNSSNLQNFQSSGKEFSRNSMRIIKRTSGSGCSANQILLCRVVVGRVASSKSSLPSNLIYHSEIVDQDIFRCRGTCLAYPQYIITYEDKTPIGFRFNGTAQACKTQQDNQERSPSKECVVCMERPVKYALVPCGHVALCERCNAPRQLRKLKKKCPECRASFQTTMMLYDRVVNDE